MSCRWAQSEVTILVVGVPLLLYSKTWKKKLGQLRPVVQLEDDLYLLGYLARYGLPFDLKTKHYPLHRQSVTKNKWNFNNWQQNDRFHHDTCGKSTVLNFHTNRRRMSEIFNKFYRTKTLITWLVDDKLLSSVWSALIWNLRWNSVAAVSRTRLFNADILFWL